MEPKGRERARLYARSLRRRQTPQEKVLWGVLRNRKFMGKKFLRQHPIFTVPWNLDVFYIADFYCHEARLVIELDGPIHEFRSEYDRRRTEVLELKGLRVLRIKNQEVEENLQGVLERIKDMLTHPPSPPSLREEKGGDHKRGDEWTHKNQDNNSGDQ